MFNPTTLTFYSDEYPFIHLLIASFNNYLVNDCFFTPLPERKKKTISPLTPIALCRPPRTFRKPLLRCRPVVPRRGASAPSPPGRRARSGDSYDATELGRAFPVAGVRRGGRGTGHRTAPAGAPALRAPGGLLRVAPRFAASSRAQWELPTPSAQIRGSTSPCGTEDTSGRGRARP